MLGWSTEHKAKFQSNRNMHFIGMGNVSPIVVLGNVFLTLFIVCVHRNNKNPQFLRQIKCSPESLNNLSVKMHCGECNKYKSVAAMLGL